MCACQLLHHQPAVSLGACMRVQHPPAVVCVCVSRCVHESSAYTCSGCLGRCVHVDAAPGYGVGMCLRSRRCTVFMRLCRRETCLLLVSLLCVRISQLELVIARPSVHLEERRRISCGLANPCPYRYSPHTFPIPGMQCESSSQAEVQNVRGCTNFRHANSYSIGMQVCIKVPVL